MWRWLQEVLDKTAETARAAAAEQEARMHELEAAAAAVKASRDSDLEIIERALGAAHHNHEAVRPHASRAP